jgi:hypothetical protein
MNKNGLIVLTVAAVLVSMVTISSASAQRRSRHANYPLSCAGVTVGITTDAQVQRMYGKGYFVRGESHLGGRYYLDPRHSVTLHVSIGTDYVVDLVEYRKGVHLPSTRAAALNQATTPRLTGSKTVQGGIRLGADSASILRLFGSPQKGTLKAGDGTMEYEATERTMPDAIGYEGKFLFRHDRLVTVSLYNGD